MFRPSPFPPFMLSLPAAHELRAQPGSSAHFGFAAALVAEFVAPAPILFISGSADWYAPGLAWMGIATQNCLFAHVTNDAEALGTAETALRGGLTGIVECRDLSRLAAKRLSLAARQGRSLCIVLRHATARTSQDSSAFTSRWMIRSSPGNPLSPAIHAQLLYAKAAMPGIYQIEFRRTGHDETPPAIATIRRAS